MTPWFKSEIQTIFTAYLCIRILSILAPKQAWRPDLGAKPKQYLRIRGPTIILLFLPPHNMRDAPAEAWSLSNIHSVLKRSKSISNRINYIGTRLLLSHKTIP